MRLSVTSLWIVVLLAVLVIGGGVGASWWRQRETQRIASECQAAIKAENWSVARPLADQWTEREPMNADAWFQRAECARQLRDLETTADSLRQIPPSDRRYLRALSMCGDLQLDGLGDLEGAIDTWKTMLRVSPRNELAHQRLIYVYAMSLQRAKLVTQIRQAIRYHAEPPESYGYLLATPNLLFSDGYLRTSRWLARQPDDETLRVARAVFAFRTKPTEGVKLFGVGDQELGSDRLIRECLQTTPRNFEVLAIFLERAVTDGDFESVARLLSQAMPEAEQDSRYWRYRGTLLESRRQLKDAADAFRKSIDVFPLDWRSHHYLAHVERLLGKPESSARHADLGIRGKDLEREVLSLPNAAQVDRDLLQRLRSFAQDCGDAEMVQGLNYRLGN